MTETLHKDFHVGPAGPGPCRAFKRGCPYGGESGLEDHYDTWEEAEQAYAEKMKAKKIPSPLQRSSSSSASAGPNLYTIAPDGHAVPAELPEHMEAKDSYSPEELEAITAHTLEQDSQRESAKAQRRAEVRDTLQKRQLADMDAVVEATRIRAEEARLKSEQARSVLRTVLLSQGIPTTKRH